MARALMTDDHEVVSRLIASGHGILMLKPLRSDPKARPPLLLAYWMGASRCLQALLTCSRQEGLDLTGLRDGAGQDLAWYARNHGEGSGISAALAMIRASVAEQCFKSVVNDTAAPTDKDSTDTGGSRSPHRGL